MVTSFKWFKKIIYFVPVFILTITSAPLVFAWTDTFGLGLRAGAMGGAFTAVSDDYSAAFYNPAGLAQRKGHHFAMEHFRIAVDMEAKFLNGERLATYSMQGDVISDPLSGASGRGLDLDITILGIEIDFNDIVRNFMHIPFNMQIGITIGVPQNGKVLWRLVEYVPDQPHFVSFGDKTNHLLAVVSCGIEVFKNKLYIGAGAYESVYGYGRISSLNTQIGMDEAAQYASANGNFDIMLKGAPIFGVLYTPFNGGLKLGASYRHEYSVNVDPLEIYVQADMGSMLSIPMDLEIAIPIKVPLNASYRPCEYSFGICWDKDPFILSVEANYQLWSQFDYTASSKLKFIPENVTGIVTDGPDFDDTIDTRIGFQYRLGKRIKLMAGYYMERTPVPDQSERVTNYIDMDRNTVSLGATYTFKKPISLHFMSKYMTMDDLLVTKENVRGYTWGNTGAPQQSYTVGGNAFMAGFAVSVDL